MHCQRFFKKNTEEHIVVDLQEFAKEKKSCKDIGTHCYWTGKKIYKLTGFLRWKVICRDIPFGKQKKYKIKLL